MPAVSSKQRAFMGAVRSYKEGGGGSSKVRKAAKSMTMNQVRDFSRVSKRTKSRSRRK